MLLKFYKEKIISTNYFLKLTFFIIAIFFISNPLNAISSNWSIDEFSKVRLISPLTNNNNQNTLTIGLEYNMDPGWKTYWKSPGDGGFPQNIDWEKSSNVKNILLKWPTPKEFEILGLKSIGYENNIIFPLFVEINNPNKETIINLSLNYLVCETICIPGNANIDLIIPPGKAKPTDFFFEIEKTLSKLPQENIKFTPIKNFEVKAFEDDTKVSIKVDILSSKNFNNPQIYLHSEFGLPVVSEIRNYSMNYKKISSTFNFPKKLFNKDTFKIEALLKDQFYNLTYSKEIKLNKNYEFNIIENFINFYLISALLGGLILNFMPCVFPILSIKLMSIINTNKNEARYSFFITSIGIIFSYMLLAIIFLILKKINIEISWGMQFQQPYFLMFISLVISIFALNMFNVFEFKLPQFILSSNFVNIGKGKFTKNFFNGFFATLLATPCSAPFVGTAITAAFTQSSLIMIGIFLFMGIGMSIPYLLVSIFPSVINFIPKPGKWMIYIRYFLGILLLLTLIWLFNILLSFFNYYFIFISILLLIFSIYFFKIKYYNFSAVVIFVIIFFLLPSVDSLKQKTSDSVDKDWIDFFTIKIEDLINDNNIIFLDITADWCATCQFNKVNVINKNDTLDLFKKNNIILVKADWTKPDKRINEFLNEYSKFGIPFNAFYSKNYPDGVVLSELLSKEEIINTIKIIKN